LFTVYALSDVTFWLLYLYRAVNEPGFTVGNFIIAMPWGQTLSTPMLGVTPCEDNDELYIAKYYRYIVLPASKDGIILRSFVLTQYRV